MWWTYSFNIQEFQILPHSIYVYCIYLKTNNNICSKQRKLIGFYKKDENVYYVIRTASLNKAICASSLKG